MIIGWRGFPSNRVCCGAQERFQLLGLLNMVFVEFFDAQKLFLKCRLKVRAHARHFGEMTPVCLIIIKFHLFGDGKFLEVNISV